MNRADTGRVLAAIAEYDRREINADVIKYWHDAIGHLDVAVALEAVAIHLKTSPWAITPAAVIDLAGQIATRTTTQRPMRRAVGQAYQIAGAINYPCPHCGADAGHYCTSATGQEAFAPCISRLTGAKTQVA
ncbi:hypothetical protein [Nocardia sp. NPDC059239]|uniref:zinc finger domain-containing protein n=1 Tax=unclassified Nocardia TaxID=2637762 RepID=UPI0036BFB73B